MQTLREIGHGKIVAKLLIAFKPRVTGLDQAAPLRTLLLVAGVT
jgi:hypothetical protein